MLLKNCGHVYHSACVEAAWSVHDDHRRKYMAWVERNEQVDEQFCSLPLTPTCPVCRKDMPRNARFEWLDYTNKYKNNDPDEKETDEEKKKARKRMKKNKAL